MLELIKKVERAVTYFLAGLMAVIVVLTVAMIAMARKVIDLDLKNLQSTTLIGIAAIIVALALAGRFFRKRCGR